MAKGKKRARAPKVQRELLKNEMPPIGNPSDSEEAIQNGFCEAIGYSQSPGYFGGAPFAGQGGFPGGGSIQQVEDSTTLFTNLRWYLVSNFRQLLSQAYVEIGLIQKIVNVPIDDGLRGGITLLSKQLDESQIKELQISLDRDDDIATCGWAAKWNRLFGGAGILILVDDQDPELPLNIASIGPNTDIEFRAVDMWELFWDKQNTEGYDPQIQAQDFEFFSYYSENVHKSRVMRLKSIQAPSFIRPRLRGWGVSVVEALVRSINQYLKATDLGFEVLDEFKIDVYKIKNLINTLLSPTGTQAIKQRIEASNWQKNYQHAIVMDAEDEYQQKQLSFSGLAEAMDGIRMQVAADMGMPITKLFGTSVSKGFATDENDMENYNSMVESEVRGKLKYDILRICEIKCQKLFGFIPDDLELEFKPLRELSALDQETVKTGKFTRLLQAKQAGEINTQEFRDGCNKGSLFDIKLDTLEDGFDVETLDDPDDAGEEPGKNPEKEVDTDDPGANREDTRKVHVDEEPESPAEKKVKNWTITQRAMRTFNSTEFDHASYEADGGSEWMNPKRVLALVELSHVTGDPLWEKAKEASMDAMGKLDDAFMLWWFKKQGGRL